MATRQRKAHPKAQKKVQTKIGTFRSRFEADVARGLTARKIPFLYEPLNLEYTVHRKYKPDFILPNGIFLELKGYLDSEDQRKMRNVKASNPDLDIRMLFMKLDGKVQGSKMTARDWCEKYDFLCAEQKVPISWIEHPPTNHEYMKQLEESWKKNLNS